MQAIPALQDLRSYKVRQSGNIEGIGWSLYDFGTYAQAGQTSLSFFQVPVGQSSKTLADTNMDLAGQLPSGQSFLIESVEIYLFPGVVVGADTAIDLAPEFSNDMYDFIKAGSLKLTIGSKTYLQEAPLGRFPPKTRLNGWGALATTDAAQSKYIDYSAAGGRPYALRSPYLLESSQNFNITLTWPTAVALSAAARIGIVMEGVLYRDVQ